MKELNKLIFPCLLFYLFKLVIEELIKLILQSLNYNFPLM